MFQIDADRFDRLTGKRPTLGAMSQTPPEASPGDLPAAVAARLAEGRARASALGLDPDALGLGDDMVRQIGMTTVPSPSAADPRVPATPPGPAPSQTGAPGGERTLQTGRVMLDPSGRLMYNVASATPQEPDTLGNRVKAAFGGFFNDPVGAAADLAWDMVTEVTDGVVAGARLAKDSQQYGYLFGQALVAAAAAKDNPDSEAARANLAAVHEEIKVAEKSLRDDAFLAATAAVAVAPFGKPVKAAAATAKALGMAETGARMLVNLEARTVKGAAFRLVNRATQGATIGGAYGYFSSDGDWDVAAESAKASAALFGAAPLVGIPLAAVGRPVGKAVGGALGAVGQKIGAAIDNSPAGPIVTGLVQSTENLFRKHGLGDVADELRTAAREHSVLGGSFTAEMEANFGRARGLPKAARFSDEDITTVAGLIERQISPADLARTNPANASRLVRAAAAEERRLKVMGRLVQAYGIPTYNPQTKEFTQFVLKKGYIPRVVVDVEQYAVGQPMREDAIKAVLRSKTAANRAAAENWIDAFIDRAKAELPMEASTGTVGRATMEARLINLPGYSTDLHSLLTRYYARTSRMIANHRRLGRNAPKPPARPAPTPEAAPVDPVGPGEPAAAPSTAPEATAPAPAPLPQGPVAVDEMVTFNDAKGTRAGRVVSIEDADSGSALGPLYRVKVPGKKEPFAVRESDLKLFRPGTGVEETMLERRARLAQAAAAPTPEQVVAGAEVPRDPRWEAKTLGREISETVAAESPVAREVEERLAQFEETAPVQFDAPEIGGDMPRYRAVMADLFTGTGIRSLFHRLISSEAGTLSVKKLLASGKKLNLEEVSRVALEERPPRVKPTKSTDFNEQKEVLSKAAMDDLVQQVKDNPAAGDFYTIGKAEMDAFIDREFPKIAQTEGGRELFKLAWAVQNIQKDVPQATADALEAWRLFDHQTLQFPLKKPNGKGFGLSDPMLATINKVLAEAGSIKGAVEYLMEPIVTKSRVKINGKNEWLIESTYRASNMFGPKIGRFWGPMVGFADEPVIDIWHIRQFRRMTGRSEFQVKAKGGKEVVVDKGATAGELALYREAMRKVTADLNANTGGKLIAGKKVPYTVSEVQALLWDSERNLWNRIAGRKEANIFPGEALEMAKRKKEAA